MKKYFLFIAAILILGSSCKKDFLSVNEVNPNVAVSSPANLILPAALCATATVMNNPKNWDFIYLWYGIWSISGGYTINADLSQYNIRNSSYQANWDNLYLAAKAFDDVQQASNTQDQAYTLGIAKIMKAYIFQNLVDMYGDVPYSQAFKGLANLKPKYDAQQGIYEDLIVQLDAAITALKTDKSIAVKPKASEDLIYGGDVTKWIKFANTLKLRILMHQAGMANRYTGYIQAKIAAITGGFIGTGEGAMVNPGYTHSSGKTNPSWAAFYNADATDSHVDGGFNYYSANESILDYMWNTVAAGDTRAYALYGYYGSYSMKGNYFGVGNQLKPDACSGIGTGNMKSFDQSAIILSDVESLFLQAEAAQRGWIGTTADASTFYYAAIKASFTNLGLTTNDWSSLLLGSTAASDYESFVTDNATDPNFSYTAAPDKLKLILTQKWVSLSGNTAVEIWTDYRRTGYPSFIKWSTDPAKKGPGSPPIRLLYTQNEINRNGDNVPAIGRNSADLFTAKIFWQNR